MPIQLSRTVLNKISIPIVKTATEKTGSPTIGLKKVLSISNPRIPVKMTPKNNASQNGIPLSTANELIIPALSLPYGVQKRVELGRALAMNPDLLLLDEPAAGMNNEETEDIARFIIDIHEEMKKTIIMVDHDMNMIMDIAEEVMVLNFGEKLAEGIPNEIVKDKKVIDAYLGVS